MALAKVSADMDIPGRLGKYEIRRLLGRGSMGSVYLGFDPLIERSVAIKILDPAFPGDATVAELGPRFRREAQAAGRLSHPNIVAVYEYSEGLDMPDGSHAGSFIAMEFVEGRTLKELFDSNKHFSFAEIARVMSELLAALSHAHENGVIHRDIKPANVMLLGNGQVKVADFGVARIETSELTSTGTTLGTIAYMSPEQFMGQPIDGRADIFSCGVILYRFLAGELPFSGSSTSIIQKLLNQEPLAPSLLNRSVPAVWDPVVRKALAKQASARFQTAAAFAEAIRAAMVADDGDATVVSVPRQATQAVRSPRARWVVAAAIGFGVVGLSVALVALVAGRSQIGTQRAQPSAAVSESDAGLATAASAALPDTPLDLAAAKNKPAAEVKTAAAPATTEIAPAAKKANEEGVAIARNSSPATVPVAPPGPSAASTKTEPSADTIALASPPAPTRAPRADPDSARPKLALATPPTATTTTRAPAAGPKTESQDARKPLADCANPDPGDKRCALALGNAYRTGRGVEKNEATALSWYRKAAALGDAQAQYAIGMMLFAGQGVPANPAQAVGWVRNAAEQGLSAAQNRLGVAYDKGEGGLQPNYVLAVNWFRKAAEQGDSAAQGNLGLMYFLGRGVIKDTEAAKALFQKSADQGHAYSYYHLAVMYERGDGAPKSDQEASYLYREFLSRSPIAQPAMLEHAKAFVAAHP
jgi:TPR repeat protein